MTQSTVDGAAAEQSNTFLSSPQICHYALSMGGCRSVLYHTERVPVRIRHMAPRHSVGIAFFGADREPLDT